jgi:glycine/D-amino acid oxidase-like deaminating enzyme
VRHADVVIIGGGVGGLSAAWHLTRGGARVALFEREPLLASHASGRNAAIFRQVDHAATHARLAKRSLELLGALAPETPALARTGGLYVGSAASVEATLALARRCEVEASAVAGAADLAAISSPLGDGELRHGVHVPGDGVLDVHAIVQALARASREAGARIAVGAEVAAVVVERGRAVGVRLASGETVTAGAVLIAAGAWATALGEGCDAPLHLVPYRRHLVMLDTDRRSVPGPVVWRVDPGEEAYFRPESGGLLASPCDEAPWPPGTPPADPDVAALLAARLARLAPALTEARVHRTWACLRTMAVDREVVVGEDPRRPGLFWMAALGGCGMTCGVALGEVAAAAIGHRPSAFDAELSPARLVGARAVASGVAAP